MANSTTGSRSRQASIEEAKAEIIGVDILHAPQPLVNLVNSQIVPIIGVMENLIRDANENRTDLCPSAHIHLRHVGQNYPDGAVKVMEEFFRSSFFTDTCKRFVDRYAPVVNKYTATTPSPT